MFHFVFAGWHGCGIVCRIGDQAAVLALYGDEAEIFHRWQIKTLDIPVGEIMNIKLVESDK
jgi:hypothetical protein